MEKTDFVIIGQVGATYGIHGWLKILSFTEERSTILEYAPWYIEEKAGWRPLVREASQEQGDKILVKLVGLNNPEEARLLSGKRLGIKREQLPALAKNEYYWRDLEGLTVINQHGVALGKIVYLIATGSNDVLVIKGDKEMAIPYLPNEVVLEIDLAKKVMRVHWENETP